MSGSTCGTLDPDSNLGLVSDLETEDSPFPAQSHKPIPGDEKDQMNKDPIETTCPKWDSSEININVISDDEGDDDNEHSNGGQYPRRPPYSNPASWQQVRKRIQCNLERKRHNKRIKTTQGNNEQMGHTAKWPSPNIHLGRTVSMAANKCNGELTVLHPSPKYVITRRGNKLKMTQTLQPWSKERRVRKENAINIKQQTEQTSPTGNLGRTIERKYECNTDYFSSKGNLGRRSHQLARRKLTMIIWHLQKKGLGV